jgi:flagellar biosynthesis protein FlhG
MSSSIWTVGSGKGGVGKTFVTSSLGITLSKLNRSILVVDFDLSGANLHTCFGLKPSEKNLRNYFDGSHKLIDLIQPTTIPRLSYIQGYWDDWSLSEISSDQVRKFIESCKNTEFDFVLIDLGAGSGLVNMEMMKLSDERIVITDPEPTSVEKLYRYLESYICHSLREHANAESFQKIQMALRDYRYKKKDGLFSFRDYLHDATGFSFEYFDQLKEHPIRLIVNSSRSRLDQDLGFSIKSVCGKYFDLKVDYLGALEYDNAVWQSVRSMEPTLIGKPFTPLAGQFLTIAKQLIAANNDGNFSAHQFKAVV